MEPIKAISNQEDIDRLTAVLKSRRSVRDGYSRVDISNQVLDDIVQSGLLAPSAKNSQPWKLHVLKQGKTMQKIADMIDTDHRTKQFAPIDPATGKLRKWSSTGSKSAQILREVSLGIFIENTCPFSGGRMAMFKAKPASQSDAIIGYGFELIGIGAMIENMWLTAQVHGLVGTYLGDVLVVEFEIKKLLEIKGDLVGALVLGYSVSKPNNKEIIDDKVVLHN